MNNIILIACIAWPSWALAFSSSLPSNQGSTTYSVDSSDPSYPPSDPGLMWESNLILQDAYVKSVQKQEMARVKKEIDQAWPARRSLFQSTPSLVETKLQKTTSVSIEPNSSTRSKIPSDSDLFAEYQQYLRAKGAANNSQVAASNGPLYQHFVDFLHGDTSQAAPAPIVVIPLTVPAPQPQQQLGPISTPQQGQGGGGPTIVGSGGIRIVTSNPISISNPINIANPNVNGQVTKHWGGRRLRS